VLERNIFFLARQKIKNWRDQGKLFHIYNLKPDETIFLCSLNALQQKWKKMFLNFSETEK
jgi:hypothetical protein